MGVAIRTRAAAALAARDGEREGVAALAVAALVYAALSGIPAGGPIVSPILASLAFLAVVARRRRHGHAWPRARRRPPGR